MPRNVCLTPFVICPPETITADFDLRRMSHELATKYAENHPVTDADLKNLGRVLWNSLGVQDNFDAVVKSADGAILPIIIESDKAEIQALPWETLYHTTHGFIGRNPAFTLTRRIADGKPAQVNLDKGPLRVLMFTSLPDNVDAERGRLNVEEEQAQVQEALLPWIAKGVVQMEMPDDGRFSTLKDLLGRFDPHVLFLSGHGKFHHEPHADEAYGTFWFESEIGDGESIRDEEIARALVGTRVQAVILSACESGKAASDYLSNGLMQRISAEGIPHVVGMRESIYDIAGIQFARALCDALAGQERMDVALQSARAAIQKAMDERGQWCLPMALSPNPQAGLIDWDFELQAVEAKGLNQRVNTVSLPARFVGRRAEMRRYKIKLTQGALRSLLITGAGGMGKTSLAGKLALDVHKARGDGLFAWSANSEKSWRDFELEMGQTLDQPRVERYDKFLPKAENEVERAKFMLDLLAEQFNGRVILFFDNLETLQDADSLAVKDATIVAWMQAARVTDGVTVFATSRWQIPDWDGEHLMLARANYGDFLQIAAMKNLPIIREQMRRVYDALGGNIRGLEFFAAAAQSMDDENVEEAFLQTLEQTKSDLQANMAIAEIYKRLPDDGKKLLARLPAYHEAVPMEGLLKLGQDFPNVESFLERLTAVSLLEASDNLQWNVTEYQCAPMVTDWMNENKLIDNSPEWLNMVADYHLYLHFNERQNLTQAMTVHKALRRAARTAEADRLALEFILRPLTRAGFYVNILTEYMPTICNSEDLHVRSAALGYMGILYKNLSNYEMALSFSKQSLIIDQQTSDKDGQSTALRNISQIFLAQGDYESAFSYLKQSLTISQQIGDKKGEGTTLNDIGNIYYAQGNHETALPYLKQALSIGQQIGDQEGESTALNNISQIFKAQGDYEMALSYLKKSLRITDYKSSEGTTLNNISALYYAQGNYEMALAYLKQSLAIFQQIGDKAGVGRAFNNISTIFQDQGDYEMALAYLKQSLAIQQQIGNKKDEGTTLSNIGEIFQSQDNPETALSYFKQSLAIRQKIGDKAGVGAALGHIGRFYSAQGDYETALSHLKQSLSLIQQIGDKADEGTTLDSIGSIYIDQCDYETALAYLKQALAIQQKIGDKKGEGTTLNNISTLYYVQGDYETALPYLKQALSISQQIGNKESEGSNLGNIGNIYQSQGDSETALSYLEHALAIQQQLGNKAGEGATLGSIGNIYYAQGSYEMALPYLKQSLAIRQLIGDKKGEGIMLSNIGSFYQSQGNYETALSYYRQSLVIRQQIGDKDGEGKTLGNIGNNYLEQGDYETALTYLNQSLAIQKQIGDKAGQCAMLFNMGHLYIQSDQVENAFDMWVTSYVIAKQIGFAQVLDALTNLALQLHLPRGLVGWEELAQEKQKQGRLKQ